MRQMNKGRQMVRFWALTWSSALALLGATEMESWAQSWSPAVCRVTRGGEVTQVDVSAPLDAYYCWGFLHARERGAQIEVLRTTGRGRLAEERGMTFLKGDFILRLFEFERRAQKISAGIVGSDREILEAYAAGVNAGDPSRFGSDPWQISDTVMLLLLQSFDQTRRSFELDISTDKHARAGDPLKQEFPWETPILKPGEYPTSRSEEHARHVPKASSVYPFAPEDQASGSNSWVVAPKYSRSGHALFANDPHLQLKSPPFWHWLQFSSPGVHLVGASLPGVPLVASGATNTIAWGLTNSYVDVADAVLVPREGLKTRPLRPVVWVKKWGVKWPIFFKSFEIVEGADLPILPIESPQDGHVIVVRWTGFDLTAADLAPLWRLSQVKGAREMDQLLSRVGLPSWNFLFADTAGNIGYRVIGRLPKRAWRERGTMEVVAPGDLKSLPLLSADEAPHLFNPTRGWIATANQLQWGSEGRFSVGSNHTESFRGFRIEELLRSGLREKHSLQTFQKIQCDQQAVDARFLLPVLLSKLPVNEVTQRLASWNFEASLDCRECALFRLWMKELGDPQWVYSRAMQSSPDFWLEVSRSLDRAVEKLRGLPDAPFVRWGDVHRASFPVIEALRPFPIRDLHDALSTGGDDHSVSPGSSDWIDGNGVKAFSHHSSASQRLVVELSNPPRIHWVLPGSNRGDSKERATSSERQDWASCQLKELTGWSGSL